jgi:hypothetical protein
MLLARVERYWPGYTVNLYDMEGEGIRKALIRIESSLETLARKDFIFAAAALVHIRDAERPVVVSR